MGKKTAPKPAKAKSAESSVESSDVDATTTQPSIVSTPIEEFVNLQNLDEVDEDGEPTKTVKPSTPNDGEGEQTDVATDPRYADVDAEFKANATRKHAYLCNGQWFYDVAKARKNFKAGFETVANPYHE